MTDIFEARAKETLENIIKILPPSLADVFPSSSVQDLLTKQAKETTDFYLSLASALSILCRMAQHLHYKVWIGHAKLPEAPDKEWRHVVYVELPDEGEILQVCWPIHGSSLHLFSFLEPGSTEWDGSSVEVRRDRGRKYAKWKARIEKRDVNNGL